MYWMRIMTLSVIGLLLMGSFEPLFATHKFSVVKPQPLGTVQQGVEQETFDITGTVSPEGDRVWSPSVILVDRSSHGDGSPITLNVINQGEEPLGFAIDALNVREVIPANQKRQITLVPKMDGIFTFYSHLHSRPERGLEITPDLPPPHHAGWILVSSTREPGDAFYHDMLWVFTRQMEETLQYVAGLAKHTHKKGPIVAVTHRLREAAMEEAFIELDVMQWSTRNMIGPSHDTGYFKEHWVLKDNEFYMVQAPFFTRLYVMVNDEISGELGAAGTYFKNRRTKKGFAHVDRTLKKLRQVKALLGGYTE